MSWVTLICMKIFDDISSTGEVGVQTELCAMRIIDLLKEVQRLHQDALRFLSSPKGTLFGRKISVLTWSQISHCVFLEEEVWQSLRKYGRALRVVVKFLQAPFFCTEHYGGF